MKPGCEPTRQAGEDEVEEVEHRGDGVEWPILCLI
jgi:hypothetical protein